MKSAEDLRHIDRREGVNGLATWHVEVCRGLLRAKRQFSVARHGDERAALQAAKVWRDTTLAQLDAMRTQLPHGASPVTHRRSLADVLGLPHPTLLAMHESSQAAGVTCLDTAWQGQTHRYTFRCDEGHQWQRSGRVQRTNPRCPVCSRVRAGLAGRKTDNLDKLHDVARERAGACLSDQYTGLRTRYQFRCAAGHEWEAHGYRVLGGNWCRQCGIDAMLGKPKSEAAKRNASLAQRRPDGLQQLLEAARAQGGRCLSEQYLGAHVRHRFLCAEGHEWETAASNVFAGSWCVDCYRLSRRLTLTDAQIAARARGGRCLSTEYVNNSSHLIWECDRGHVWKAPLATIRSHGCWCAQCAHMARITNRKSKAQLRYVDGGKHLMGETPPEG